MCAGTLTARAVALRCVSSQILPCQQHKNYNITFVIPRSGRFPILSFMENEHLQIPRIGPAMPERRLDSFSKNRAQIAHQAGYTVRKRKAPSGLLVFWSSGLLSHPLSRVPALPPSCPPRHPGFFAARFLASPPSLHLASPAPSPIMVLSMVPNMGAAEEPHNEPVRALRKELLWAGLASW